MCLAVSTAWADNHVYATPALNPGLPAPPEHLDRSTPQSTMEALSEAARSGDWESAAHLLDLRDVPEDRQATEGPVLAAQLWMVIDRKVNLDWHDLLDRPDAMDASATSDRAVAGQPRRSILLWLLDLEDRPVSLRLNRVQEEGGEPVWVFARQSVRNIPALAALYQPSRLERMLPEALRTKGPAGLFWWEIIALPIAVLVAALAGYATHRLTRAAARKLERPVLRAILRSLATPLVIGVITAVVAFFAGRLFVFSGRIDLFLTPLILVGFVTAGLMLVVNALDAVLDRLISFDQTDLNAVGDGIEHNRRTATRLAAARRALIVVGVLAGAGIVLSTSNISQIFGFSLLASAGAITLVLAFAARNVLGNIMSSLQIALNQSARIGDKVVYKGYLCTVERINFTYVQLRVWTGERLVVPVEEFASESFENWMLQDPAMVRTVELKLAHTADVGRLTDAYERILDRGAEEEEWRLGDREERGVHVSGHDVFGMDVLFKVPTTDPNTAWTIACEVRRKLLAEAARLEQEEGLTLFPEAAAAEAAG